MGKKDNFSELRKNSQMLETEKIVRKIQDK